MLRTSGFMDDVMFSHSGVNGPESKTTLCYIEFAQWQHQGQSWGHAWSSPYNGSRHSPAANWLLCA